MIIGSRSAVSIDAMKGSGVHSVRSLWYDRRMTMTWKNGANNSLKDALPTHHQFGLLTVKTLPAVGTV